MSEIRQRQAPRASSNKDESTSQRRPHAHTEEERGISILDIIRVLATLVLAVLGTSYYMTDGESVMFGYRPWFTRLALVKQAVVSNRATPTARPTEAAKDRQIFEIWSMNIGILMLGLL